MRSLFDGRRHGQLFQPSLRDLQLFQVPTGVAASDLQSPGDGGVEFSARTMSKIQPGVTRKPLKGVLAPSQNTVPIF